MKNLARQYVTLMILGEQISLTKKQNEFARQVALTGELTQSRLKAGYANVSTNKQAAYNLAENPKIQKAIEYYKQQVAEKLDISENRILAEFAACGFSNAADLFDDEGRMTHPKHAPPHVQRAIAQVDVKRYVEGKDEEAQEVEILKIKMHPKLPALEKIAELKGMTAPKDPGQNRPVNVNIAIKNDNISVNSEG